MESFKDCECGLKHIVRGDSAGQQIWFCVDF
jgi:hypothetical protein